MKVKKAYGNGFISLARVDVRFMTYTVLKLWRVAVYIYPKRFKERAGRRVDYRIL